MNNTTTDTFEMLDLRKEKVQKIALEKGIPQNSLQFVLCLDFSGSMDSLYRNGAVQELVEKLLPFGLAMDANQAVDVYIFDDTAKRVKECRLSNVKNFVNNNIVGKYQMGGTNYAPIIDMIVKDFGGTMHDHNTISSLKSKWGGMLAAGINKVSNRLAGKDVIAGNTGGSTGVKQFEHPVYVAFVTDGDCGDKAEATRAMVNAAYNGVFFQFIGIGNTSFSFLQKLDTMEGRLIDNANFQKAADIMNTSDDKLYDILFSEYPQWLPQAKQQGLIA